MSYGEQRFHLRALAADDVDLNVAELDKDMYALRGRLVRRRFFASLLVALEQVPEIAELKFYPGGTKDFVQPVTPLDGYDEVCRGKLAPRNPDEVNWVKFDKLMTQTRKAIGPSNQTAEALFHCLPSAPDKWGHGRSVEINVTREEAIMICQEIAKNDMLSFTRETLHAMALEMQVGGASATAAPRPRM